MKPFRLVLLLFLSGLIGCATREPTAPLGNASQRQGLVNWEWSETRSLTADLVLGYNSSGDLDLAASKGSVLIELRRRGEEWSASGPLAAIPWRGTREDAPGRLVGWIAFADTLVSIQKAPDHIDGWMSGTVRARWTDESAEIVIADSGERFRVRWRGKSSGPQRQ